MGCTRLLFIDDEASAHFAMREYFGDLGWLMDSARSAAEALDLFARRRYDAVIADLRLSPDDGTRAEPGGLALVERIRREHPGTRVLVLTACGDEVEREARRRGADVFLQKPQPLERVAGALRTLCRGQP